MDAIWELIRQNPFLLILLLGALTGFFRKKPQEEEQKKRQQQKRQTEQTNSQSSYPNREDVRQEAKPVQTEEKPRFDWDIDIFQETKEELEKKVRETFSPYMEKKKEQVSTIQDNMKDKVQELSIKQQEISRNSPILKQELQLSEGKVVNDKYKINPKRVVEGVMWSEILGQPRSRNPHRPIYSQHFSAARKKR
ncbi:hypothetical protein [Sutcliffiella halmapala]|uniref:hypothetical protein n=1 Tax=Sutcliffiella halmapala TaxID=79882 RepID=UPI000995A608|nr:hypothetical protein [Sutcliffiella halmapala]